MRIHAIRTGSVRIKRSQVRGRGRGLRRRLRIFADPLRTEWLPTYAWMIDHPEGLIVVDTGQGDVIAVATPGHTASHLSVIVRDEGITYVLAGDASYTEALMLAGPPSTFRRTIPNQQTGCRTAGWPTSHIIRRRCRIGEIEVLPTSTSCGLCDGSERTALRFSPPLCGR